MNLSKTTDATLGSRVFLSSGEALCIPSLPEVTSLLVVEIVAGRGACLSSVDIGRQTSPEYIYHAGGNVGPRSLILFMVWMPTWWI